MGEWKVCTQDPWYVECDASDYSSVGISHNGKIKAIAVGFGDEDYSDEIVAALNSHDALIEERDRLRAALESFCSGGNWGKIKAMIVNGATVKEDGIAFAKWLTTMNAMADAVVDGSGK